MPKRKKIIIIVSILAVIGLAFGLYIYFRDKKIKADVNSASIVNYYGYVTWSDGTPASGKAVSVANRQTLIQTDGSYTFYLTDSDFSKSNLSAGSGAQVSFYDPKTYEQYNEYDRLTSTSLPKPTTPGTTLVPMTFVLEKVAAPKPNNFALVGSPVVTNKTVAFSFSFVNPTDVSVAITGASGNKVATVTQSFSSGTTGTVTWNGKDSAGRPVANGTYRATIVGNDNQNPITALAALSVALK